MLQQVGRSPQVLHRCRGICGEAKRTCSVLESCTYPCLNERWHRGLHRISRKDVTDDQAMSSTWFLEGHNPIQLKTVLLQKVFKVRAPDWSWFPAFYPCHSFQCSSGSCERQVSSSSLGWEKGELCRSFKSRQMSKVCLGRLQRSRLAAESGSEVRALSLD